jgi:hypothetical protein
MNALASKTSRQLSFQMDSVHAMIYFGDISRKSNRKKEFCENQCFDHIQEKPLSSS